MDVHTYGEENAETKRASADARETATGPDGTCFSLTSATRTRTRTRTREPTAESGGGGVDAYLLARLITLWPVISLYNKHAHGLAEMGHLAWVAVGQYSIALGH